MLLNKYITNIHTVRIKFNGFLVGIRANNFCCSTEDLISWLQGKGLLPTSRTCSSCSGIVTRLGKRGDVSDGCVWRCPQCKTTKSVREGSFFTKSRMPLKKWLLLLYCWIRQYPAKDASEEAMVESSNVCDVYR